MPSIISNIVGSPQVNDQTIAIDMIMAAKGAAAGYLTATLEAATPEAKALFTAHLNEVIAGHEMLVGLAVKEGWYKPYASPMKQLEDARQQSEDVIQRK